MVRRVAEQVGPASSRQPEDDAERWGRSRNCAEWKFCGYGHIIAIIHDRMFWYCVVSPAIVGQPPLRSSPLASYAYIYIFCFEKCKCNRLYHATMSMLIGYVHIGMHVFMDKLEWMAYVRVAYTQLSSASQASIGRTSVCGLAVSNHHLRLCSTDRLTYFIAASSLINFL